MSDDIHGQGPPTLAGITMQGLQARVAELEGQKETLLKAGKRMIANLEDKVRELEAELKTANHWRERHSRNAEAYGIQSNENWKRVRELEDVLSAQLRGARSFAEGLVFEKDRLAALAADGGGRLDALISAVALVRDECERRSIQHKGFLRVAERLTAAIEPPPASPEAAPVSPCYVGTVRGDGMMCCKNCGAGVIRIRTYEREPLVLDDDEPEAAEQGAAREKERPCPSCDCGAFVRRPGGWACLECGYWRHDPNDTSAGR
jgi:hypothetical protein